MIISSQKCTCNVTRNLVILYKEMKKVVLFKIMYSVILATSSIQNSASLPKKDSVFSLVLLLQPRTKLSIVAIDLFTYRSGN